VVVDEAQELSAMTWRLLMRRSPLRSMTLVGDIAQTGALAGARSWDEVLDPYVEGRWTLEELTVNYRTPAQIMTLASAVLAAAGIPSTAPISVREGDSPPVATRIDPADPRTVVDAVAEELEALGGGRLAVIVTREDRDGIVKLLTEGLPDGSVSVGQDALDSPVAVLTVAGVKGLEFDTVVLLEPAAILRESSRGANDLYVAVTRPTQRLRVLHAEPLPPGLDALSNHSPD
jgi:DNA helicase IV